MKNVLYLFIASTVTLTAAQTAACPNDGKSRHPAQFTALDARQLLAESKTSKPKSNNFCLQNSKSPFCKGQRF